MFNFFGNSKEEEIEKQHKFENVVYVYLYKQGLKEVEKLLPLVTDESYQKFISELSSSGAMDILKELPKEQMKPLLNRIAVLIPYDEEQLEKVIGAAITLVVLRTLTFDKVDMSSLSSEDEDKLLIAFFTGVVNEIEQVHENYF